MHIITNGSNIDVLEIDGASNRGIDEIRDLRDKVKLAPAAAQKKVYIIDEVHMLTTEAFNALLKTIEEPPSHVMFIFCTTEPQKVPPTIISRCFHIAFSKATEKEIVHSLERIVKGENLDIDKEVLLEIAKLSDGGFRDSAKILEEIVMKAGGKKITQELFEQSYKSAHILLSVNNFLIVLAPERKDLKESIAIIKDLIEQGVDMKLFVVNLLSTLHDLLLSKLGVNDLKFSYSDKYDIQDIKELSTLLDSSYQQIKYSVLPQLPLELAVLEWCKKEDSGLMISTMGGSASGGQDSRMSSKNTMSSLIKEEKALKVQAILRKEEPEKVLESAKTDSSQEELMHKGAGNSLLENLIYKVKPYNHSVAGVLRGCVIKSIGDGQVVFEAAYKFHKERLDDSKTREILEKGIKEITGKNLKVLIELKG